MGAWVHNLVSSIRSVAQGLDLLATVQVESVESVDDYGQPVYSAPRSIKCVLTLIGERESDEGVRRRVGAGAAHAEIIIPADETIVMTDRITLPDGSKKFPLKIDGVSDPTGKRYAVNVTV